MQSAAYEKRKAYNSRRLNRQSSEGRDIAPLPDVVDPARKEACRLDFRRHCEVYHAETFHLPWCDDHLRVIDQIETSVLRGGLFATATPRGSGKTSIVEVACEWAALYGHRYFITLIGSCQRHTDKMLESIKLELETNDLLYEDFPEVCHAIRSLEGISHRCRGQLCDGERTHIGWTADEIILPTIPGSRASGSIIRVATITGNLRGMKHKRPDRRTIRPDLVVVDDPQTDDSANSPAQCETRERILAGAILGLAGPGRKISGIMPCTVIRRGDMADNILDRQKHPEWNGTRTKMLYSFPTNEKLWEEYRKLWSEGQEAGRGTAEATEFYRANREAMDVGAVVAWPERFEEDEISAVQHAMNLFIRNRRAFFAEFQNQPEAEEQARSDDLTSDQVAAKINRIPRGVVPLGCTRLTAFIDVHASLLYYVVCGWEDDFTGYVIDYGSYPGQKRPYFSLRDAKPTLQDVFKAAGLEGQIYGGLEALTAIILGKAWPRDDGAETKVERCLIDARWGTSTPVVKQFCRQSAHAAVVMPSFGRYVGASGVPMTDYRRQAGERVGLNWHIPRVEQRGEVRAVSYDANFWKSFIHARLSTAMGDRGCLSLFGSKPEAHRLFADHLTAEFRVRTSGRGREVDEWKVKPDRPENHYLDTAVGAAVAASIQGVVMPETSPPVDPKRGKVSFADLQKRKGGRA